MEIKLTDTAEHEKELQLTVPWQIVAGDYDALLRDYARVPVRGFRPGKTPCGLIESMFRAELDRDLVAAVAVRLCRRALEKEGIEAGSPLEIVEHEVEKGNQLSLRASFIEMPQFELPDYARLHLTATDEEGMLDEISERLLAGTEIPLHKLMVAKELEFSEDGNEEFASKRVRLMLILKRIAAQEGIEVRQKDIEERIREVAAENGVSAAELKQFLVQGNGLGRLADSLLAEKVLSYIIDIQN